MEGLNDGRGVPITLAALERLAILNALNHTGWCATRAATLLGIGRSTLYRKIDEYRIVRGEVPMVAVVEIVEVAPGPSPASEIARRFPPGSFGSPEANAALAEMVRAMRAEQEAALAAMPSTS